MIDYRMTIRKYVTAMAAILATCALLIFTYYKEQKIKLHPVFKTSTMQNLHLIHREDSAIKWELTATEAVFPIGEKEIFLTSLGLKINNTPEIRLTSGSGIYEIENGNILLNKSVEMNMKDHRFLTDTLKWNSKDNLISTDDDIKFIGKDFIIEGTGLSATLKQQKIHILKNVKATFNIT